MFSQNIGAMYDSYLAQQTEDYMNSFCEGEPKIIDAYQEFEGYDADGNMEYSTHYEYSCSDCDNEECEHWKDFHEVDEDES